MIAFQFFSKLYAVIFRQILFAFPLKRLLLFTLLCSFISVINAQTYQLTGTIVTEQENRKIEGASIFINNASIGTTSDKEGSFSLLHIPFAKFELVVSHISYETVVVPITADSMGKHLIIKMQPKKSELQDVVVVPADKYGWQKWGSLFTRNFIGTTDLSQECTIKNPEVLRFRFNKTTGRLRVTAVDKVLIENKALGYIIAFQLEEFVYDRKQSLTSFVGYTSFTPMKTTSEHRQRAWKKKRLEAYNGSLMHFMRSLYQNKLVEDKFEIHNLRRLYSQDSTTRALYDSLLQGSTTAIDESKYLVQVVGNQNNGRQSTIYITGRQVLPTDSIRRYDSAAKTVSLYFENDLRVIYKNEKEKLEYIGMSRQPQWQRSVIYLLSTAPITVEPTGMYFNPLNLLTEEYWGWEKMAEMVPSDYQPGD